MSSDHHAPPQPTSAGRAGASRLSTVPDEDPGSTHTQQETPKQSMDGQAQSEPASSKTTYQRFVLTDPVAFRYLEEDPSTAVLERRRELHGYECYIVEQWTTSRTHPTFVITTYTGDPSHVVVVSVLSVPTDESTWSARLRVYFKALNQNHARRKDTPLGILMVTSLSGFTTSLTVVAVPDGDLRKHRFDFFVNENLKRLNCSGRLGLTLSQPSPVTAAKFHQLYKVSDKNDIYKSVIELVKLCQSALMLFEHLPVDYADGLLCDMTERALGDWWREMGTEHYNIEPHDGILGPTTVAGLLGLLMGARNRLQAVNAPVPKDPFDIEAMKQGIVAFQKQQRLPRSKRLDRRTLDRLHKASQKAAEKAHWMVPKAVKSTVAELSGKGGEMVMDAVGRKDKAGIAEIETVDIEKFMQLAYGDRCKWLWHGKPLKKGREMFSSVSNEVHDVLTHGRPSPQKPDERNRHTRATDSKGTIDADPANWQELEPATGETLPEQRGNEAEDSDDMGNKASMLKRATLLKNEAKSGISKVRDAVGFRGHKTKPSVDDRETASPEPKKETKRPPMLRAHTSPYTSPASVRSEELGHRDEGPATAQSSRLNIAIAGTQTPGLSRRGSTSGIEKSAKPANEGQDAVNNSRGQSKQLQGIDNLHFQHTDARQRPRRPSESKTVETAIRDEANEEGDSDDNQAAKGNSSVDGSMLLRRTASHNAATGKSEAEPFKSSTAAFPRHLSFSLAEDSILNHHNLSTLSSLTRRSSSSSPSSPSSTSDNPYRPHPEKPRTTLRTQLADQTLRAHEAQDLHAQLAALRRGPVAWTQGQLAALDALLPDADARQDTLDGLHRPQLETVQALARQSQSQLGEERAALEEGAKGLETLLARLEYEIDGLRAKVEDVQAAQADFEAGVGRVEERVLELEVAGERGAGWGCVVC